MRGAGFAVAEGWGEGPMFKEGGHFGKDFGVVGAAGEFSGPSNLAGVAAVKPSMEGGVVG